VENKNQTGLECPQSEIKWPSNADEDEEADLKGYVGGQRGRIIVHEYVSSVDQNDLSILSVDEILRTATEN
jgi:hypothetical protein